MPDITKKLAEVAAFAVIGKELIARGRAAAEIAFGEETARLIYDRCADQHTKIAGQAHADKLERTVAKLTSMMEVYIGDSWDDPLELLEWSGFFFGAAQIHWTLVASLAGADENLADYAHNQATIFGEWLDNANRQIFALGPSK